MKGVEIRVPFFDKTVEIRNFFKLNLHHFYVSEWGLEVWTSTVLSVRWVLGTFFEEKEVTYSIMNNGFFLSKLGHPKKHKIQLFSCKFLNFSFGLL
jgi:hypothetical protein